MKLLQQKHIFFTVIETSVRLYKHTEHFLQLLQCVHISEFQKPLHLQFGKHL